MSKGKYAKGFSAALNMQNPPRPDFMFWYVRLRDETSDPEYSVLGYEFTQDRREDSIGKAEGSSPRYNFRKCFLPEEGHYLVSRDYSGQELRILANLSGEPSWIETFNTGGDIHRLTAETVWGAENYTSDLRNKAKAINFGLVYGTTAMGLSDSIGVSVNEAQSYIDKFFDSHRDIDAYLRRNARVAGQNKTLANHYGRSRRYHNYIDRDNPNQLDGYGERRAFNFPIQSMGADVTKLGLLNVYYNVVKNPDYEGKALWMSTIHDEINLSVAEEILEEVVSTMGEVMEHTIQPGYPVKITTGLDIGTSMGMMWEFEQDPETKELIPVFEPLED